MKLKEGKNNHTYVVEKIQVKFRGTRFALGRRIADNIFVKEAAA